ncbi:hypothetical protein [Cellulosimicrobium composti]|nr:hypothetical protein [Cellulosimicrobium composti]
MITPAPTTPGRDRQQRLDPRPRRVSQLTTPHTHNPDITGHMPRTFAGQGLVLFELLARLNADGHVPFADQAELRVLWDLEAQLESSLTAVMASNYHEQLTAAHGRIQDTTD